MTKRMEDVAFREKEGLADNPGTGAPASSDGAWKSLGVLYDLHKGKVSDKWSFYLDAYDRVLAEFREKPIHLLEIGVQNGGSLEIWDKYFSNAETIVGCDVDEKCGNLKYDSDRIHLVIGNVNEKDTEGKIGSISSYFDVVIDDGSHRSADIISSFVRYFPYLNDGGIYVVEDLHASYWQDYDGGLYHPLSSMAFLKRLVDVINQEHWGLDYRRTDALSIFFEKYNSSMGEGELSTILAVEFMNSLCIIRKRSSEKNTLGFHHVAGHEATINEPIVGLDGTALDAPDQTRNPWSPQSMTIEEEIISNRSVRTQSTSMSDVAVIIPFYNGSKFIRRAVDSVLSQTVLPAEFVVVNDGSKPEEAAFLHALAEEMNFVVLDKENGGQGSARNAGVVATSSPFICFLDQDDLYLPEHIEVLRRAATEDRRFGWAYADLMLADVDAQIVRTSIVKAHSSHPKTDVFAMVGGDMFVLPSASIVSRSAFNAVGGFDSQFMGYEDDDLFLRMFRAGYTNTFIDQSVTIWCVNAESTSYSMRMSRSRFRYFKKLYQAFPSDPVRAWYVLRDLLMPRFHTAFIGEAFQAICRPRSPRGQVLHSHADELLQIATEYRDIVLNDKFISWRRKLKIRMQTFLLGTRSPLLCEAALLFANFARRFVR